MGPVDDDLELTTQHVHRAEHVVLRHPDADVHPADPAAALEIGLVPRAEKEHVHPAHQGHLEHADLALASLEHPLRPRVGQDPVVEDPGDPLELGLDVRVESPQRLAVGASETHVPLELVEHGGRP